MAAASAEVLNMSEPIPFIITKEDGALTVNPEAVHVLRMIESPVSVITIVGKYQTGKSYIMNRIFNTKFGFELSGSVQSVTKGIWLWAKPHPLDPRRALILLDTEGLHNAEKVDSSHDMKLFTLSLLLSNLIVYNAMGVIDDVMTQELHLVTKLTEHIKTKENEEETGNYFSKYFPSFFLLLRDFYLDVQDGKEDLTPDQYMEKTLKLKTGNGKEIDDYNEPRSCIRSYFPQRQCHALCKPVEDEYKLKHMDEVSDVEIKPQFFKDCKIATDAMIQAAIQPFIRDGVPITGRRLADIASMYVEAMNKEGGIPCISNTVQLMKNHECTFAREGAVLVFELRMSEELQNKNGRPVEVNELLEFQKFAHKAALDHYFQHSVFDQDGTYMKQFRDELENKYQLHLQDNDEESRRKCSDLINTCFQQLKENLSNNVYINDGYQLHMNGNDEDSRSICCDLINKCFQQLREKLSNNVYITGGGYMQYRNDKRMAIEMYRDAPKKGPFAEKALDELLKITEQEEHVIIDADMALEEKDKQIAKEREEKERAEIQAKEESQWKERLMNETLRLHSDQKELILKMQEDAQSRYDQLMQEYVQCMKEKEDEYTRLVSEGSQKQAEQFKILIENMRCEKEATMEEHKKELKLFQKLNKNKAHLVDEIVKLIKDSTKPMNELYNEIVARHKLLLDKDRGILEDTEYGGIGLEVYEKLGEFIDLVTQ